MGLDISHIRATLERPKTKNPDELGGTLEEYFDGFNVPLSHFGRYIQEIDCANILTTSILVKEEKYLQYTIEWLKDYDYNIFFEKEPSKLEKVVEAFELRNRLTNLEKYRDSNPEKWELLYHYEIVKKVGFYTTEEGYQRKGMNDEFRKRFFRDDIFDFALKEDFEFAYQCIDYYWEETKEEVEKRRKNFKTNFLDKFELGASYLSVSY